MIYFSFDPRPQLKEELIAALPDENLIFSKRLDEAELEKAEIFVTYGEDVRAEDLQRATHLKWIFVASAGIEKMPLRALEKSDVIVSNVRGIHKTPMAESVLGHILAHYRSLPIMYKEQEQKNWRRKMPSKELRGQRALILGPGAIGGEIGRLLQAFGVETIGCNRTGKQVEYMNEMVTFDELDDVLPQVDIVLSMLPSTKETYHLWQMKHFEAMKSDALFLNFGRGDFVESSILERALREEKIGAAICDVFENEPLEADSPLWALHNLTVSPHVSSHSSRYLERSFDIFKRNIARYRAGDFESIENKVNLKEGY